MSGSTATKTALISPIFPASSLPRIGTRSPWLISACMLASDLLALALVSCVTVIGRHLVGSEYHLSSYLEFLPFLAMLIPAFLFQGLYPGLLIHPAEEMRRIFYSLSLVFFIWASVTFLFRTGTLYSRSVFLITWFVGSPVVLLLRYLTRRYLSRKPWWGVSAVILGSGPTAQRVVRKLRTGMLGIKVVGVFGEEQVLSWANDLPPVLGDLQSASGLVGSRIAQYAILAIPDKSNLDLCSAIQDYCRGFSHVLLVPNMYGVCSLGVTACDIQGELGLELPQRLFHRGARFTKRVSDSAASFLTLLLLAPLFALIAAAIKLTSKGPIFYAHPRIGQEGRVFKTLKFRTMVPGADRILADFLVTHPEYLLEWERDRKLRNDPRVTLVGKWLRRFSMDELPQMLNVLVGQMSMVGPRPLPLDDLEKYGCGYGLFTRVPPGITGLWQVSGRNNTTYQERVNFDEYYVRNWSIWLDLYILICTIKVVLTAEGAY